MSYKTSNAEGHVDFINTYDLEPMAQQVTLKLPLVISLVGQRILSLYARTSVPLTDSSFLIRFVMLKIQVQKLNLQVKNYLHQLLWHLLRLINW